MGVLLDFSNDYLLNPLLKSSRVYTKLMNWFDDYTNLVNARLLLLFGHEHGLDDKLLSVAESDNTYCVESGGSCLWCGMGTYFILRQGGQSRRWCGCDTSIHPKINVNATWKKCACGCGYALDNATTGRPRRYYSNACKQKVYRLSRKLNVSMEYAV